MSVDVLIVEDDHRLADLIGECLGAEGLRCAWCARGDHVVEQIDELRPRLIILDLLLPGSSGIEICRAVRSRFLGAILILTSSKADTDEILGFEHGADDYVVKPVKPRVLLARINNLLRRMEAADESSGHIRNIGDLHLDGRTKEARLFDELVHLTVTEFEVLWLLSAHPGELVRRDVLYQKVLRVRYDGLDRGMDIHISRIRRKLLAIGLERTTIKSIRGEGYLLTAV